MFATGSRRVKSAPRLKCHSLAMAVKKRRVEFGKLEVRVARSLAPLSLKIHLNGSRETRASAWNYTDSALPPERACASGMRRLAVVFRPPRVFTKRRLRWPIDHNMINRSKVIRFNDAFELVTCYMLPRPDVVHTCGEARSSAVPSSFDCSLHAVVNAYVLYLTYEKKRRLSAFEAYRRYKINIILKLECSHTILSVHYLVLSRVNSMKCMQNGHAGAKQSQEFRMRGFHFEGLVRSVLYRSI